MLYDEFNSHKNFAGIDVFNNKADEKAEILKNLNPAFDIREYQKEALGRFYFYLEEYPQRQDPVHLMFNMATGSGKTLIMAANILYLYQKGYRNFIFFTRLGNIIQKTKSNFLDPLSKKYLFAKKIILGGREIKIKEVDNFEGADGDGINIVFTTIANLHKRFNSAKENSLTYEDFAGKKVVLIADEAHNFSAETRKKKYTKEEENDKNSWERTILGDKSDLFNVPGILNSNRNKENVLLEFTATARLEEEYPEMLEKYKDKAIFRYDLKEYRLDGFSKEVRTLQINAPLMERALSAIIISQYRRKVAEKNKIALKPVVMFKANRINPPKDKGEAEGDNPQIVVSGDFKGSFHRFISGLSEDHLKRQASMQNDTLQKAFKFFKEQKVSMENLAQEIKSDFAPEKCLTVDEEKDLEQKQMLLNSLEDPNNEIRAVFATEKLNEGWDVLNLFDIVRLYNSRDEGKTEAGRKPGKTTVQEAQLIGRGARYYPFAIEDYNDRYCRKFDGSESRNELRILEQLYYHSVTNPRYIQELESVLIREGIMPPRTVKREIKIKDDFKIKEFWKNGYIFLNSQKEYIGENIFSLKDAEIYFDHNDEKNVYSLSTGETKEKDIFTDFESSSNSEKIEIKEFEISGFGSHIIRFAFDKIPAGKFEKLKRELGNVESINKIILDKNYLGEIRIKVKGTEGRLKNISQEEKIRIAAFAIGKIIELIGKDERKFFGTKEFYARPVKDIFRDVEVRLDSDSFRAQSMRDFDFSSRDWFAQSEIWGTGEEESFLKFMDEAIIKLQKKYGEIALFRNENFFNLFSFSKGEPFYPDFVLFLREKNTNKEIAYQIFIESKGDQFLDENKTFEKSKEGWKQEFLLEIEKNFEIALKLENKDFRLIGLPFYNDGQKNGFLRENFEEEFKNKLLQ